ncbi:MAG TPA: four-carbon acid sugar kinase family protein [Microvirga sp.]|jgi:uncharacterized protein YgbK (DUF1537 family)|nr:four-carbon acid sugar kinase family protein [Microvirga sp.]
MIDILILADDLSGAADCASACLRDGRSPLVLIDPLADPGDAAVVAVDVDSRARPAPEAGTAMAAQVRRLFRPETRILYQKMDSTLRGNWARETAGVLEALAATGGYRPLAIAAPAFPAAGRTLVDGRSLLNGTPLEATETWERESRMREGSTPAAPAARLAAEGLRVAQASLGDVRSGPDRLSALFAGAGAAGADVVVCDAQTDADLAAIAGAALALVPVPLCVGSAGLMRALAGGSERAAAPPARRHAARAGPVLIAVGSASQVSHGQVRTLVDARGMTAIGIAPAALRGGASSPLRSVSERIDAALDAGRDLVVAIDGREGVDLRGGPALSAALADLVAPRLPRLGGLIATGGETARAILTRSGVPGLRIRGEVEPGVPVSSAEGASGLAVITKAGAFGDSMTLVRCLDIIRGVHGNA